MGKKIKQEAITFSHKEWQKRGLQRFRVSYPSPREADTACDGKPAVDIYKSKLKYEKKNPQNSPKRMNV